MQQVNRPSNIGAGNVRGGKGGGAGKDPRPIRDKAWQATAKGSLISFLVQTGYNQVISMASLSPPSSKDFQSIFRFLYARIDPTYVFVKKFEDEVQSILKEIKYPLADQITKSNLMSVGSMHAWPSILAMLTWMVELILFPTTESHLLLQCLDQLDNQGDFDDGTGINDPTDPEKIFFNYLIKAYANFLEGDDDFELMDAELVHTFDVKNENTVREVERLKKENERAEQELDLLKRGESPLVILEREKNSLQLDKEQFIRYIQHVRAKKPNLEESIASLKQDLEAAEKEIASATEERAALQHTVDSQEVSPADVDRMNAENEQLAKTLADIATKLELGNQAVWKSEIELQKKMDQIEKLVQDYNACAYRLGLYRAETAEPVLAAELEINPAASRPQDITSIDMRNAAKPALLRLRTSYNSDLHAAQDDAIALHESLDSLNWAFTEKEDELAAMESRILQLGEQCNEEERHIGLSIAAVKDEIGQYERNIQRISIEANGSLIQSQQRAQKAAMEYEELSRRVTEKRGRVMEQVVKSILELVNVHMHVRSHLAELKQMAEKYHAEAVAEVEALP
ncbi:HEC/Ndc80p family-domain-containing protein [Blyttiomyces helicus]|uniref:Kinetochore protein NDC80 n=1 Tax=Blyttiomyces helicus TaxID=388810 RepID=A0A4P9W2K3_9FUNG|nr:HEC/Ndc80p family-domain-containing protein [Blyttiomyces helicus]|eukprot:RKO85028.1 HEC/Ndc80p family-domain-containing protein [Blyttiomyces helicus]